MSQTNIIIQTIISLAIFISFLLLEGKIQKKTFALKITKIALKVIGIFAGIFFIAGVGKLIWG